LCTFGKLFAVFTEHFKMYTFGSLCSLIFDVINRSVPNRGLVVSTIWPNVNMNTYLQ